MMLALIFTVIAQVYGSYGSLPVIVHVSTSAVCGTLRQTVIPVGYIAKTNDAAFGDVKTRTLKVAMSQLSDDTDFEFLARHDQVDTGAVLSNIQLAIDLIDKNKKLYPAAKNPEIEAMRAELVSVLDLQRQYNSVIDSIAGSYLDSTSNKQLYGGFEGTNTQAVAQRDLMAKRDFINANRVLLGLQPFDEQGVQPLQNPFTQPIASASPGSREQMGGPQLQAQLSDAEGRLQVTALAALRLCNGGPKASPSPKP
jgi:hypothetical protein